MPDARGAGWRFEIAANHFQRMSLAKRMDDIGVIYQLGRAYVGMRQYLAALDDYARVIEHWPDYPNVYFSRCVAYC